jgi:exosortase A-associated hydrolase 2
LSKPLTEAFFFQGAVGRLFAVLYRSRIHNRCLIVVPPFAEEMNRCRRQISETARLIAESHCSVLVPDFFGTGDSEGEFADARWDIWVQDLICAGKWAASTGFDANGVLSVRLGSAIVADAMRHNEFADIPTAFWQPIVQGQVFLRQFLRLKVAAEMSRQHAITVEDVQSQLDREGSVNVGGYEISAELAGSIQDVTPLTYKDLRFAEVAVLELLRGGKRSGQTEGSQLIEALGNKSADVSYAELSGLPYWSLGDGAVSRSLAEETLKWVKRSL